MIIVKILVIPEEYWWYPRIYINLQIPISRMYDNTGYNYIISKLILDHNDVCWQKLDLSPSQHGKTFGQQYTLYVPHVEKYFFGVPNIFSVKPVTFIFIAIFPSRQANDLVVPCLLWRFALHVFGVIELESHKMCPVHFVAPVLRVGFLQVLLLDRL